MKLRYTPQAVAELEEVLSYIAERSPEGARRVRARIQAVTTLLVEHPKSGQATSIRDLRRVVASPYPYLIFYEVMQDEVIVIGIRHGARDPASMPGEETHDL